MYVCVADVIQLGLKYMLLFVLVERDNAMLNATCCGSAAPAALQRPWWLCFLPWHLHLMVSGCKNRS